jgi:hypothetical protein
MIILDAFNIRREDCHENFKFKPVMSNVQKIGYALLFIAIIVTVALSFYVMLNTK